MSSAPQSEEPVESQRAYSLVAIPPQSYGKYTLIGKLGHGGMAEVNLAVADGKAGFRKLTVIKRLHPHLAVEPGFIEMFLDEARLAARLNHPHCVQTYEVDEYQGSHYLAMEYLDGQGLERLLRVCGQQEIPLEPALAARIVSDALDGLAYAHELTDYDGSPLTVVHRDVSPQNIFVTYNGMVKLLDFGIAKAATHVVETRTGVIKGKYAYIAPEQALGQDVDQRSDLWSMGVVLWECLTGRRLFKSINELATLHETLQGEIKLPSAFRPELSTELDTICMRALQRAPDQRYQTAQEMREELERYLVGVTNSPTRKDVSRAMRDRFAEAIVVHKRTLSECLQGSGAAISESTIERLVDPSHNTPRPAGLSPADSGLSPPPFTPTPAPLSVTPPPVLSAQEPAEPRRRGGLVATVILLVLVLLLSATVAVLLPLSFGGEDPSSSGSGASVVVALNGDRRSHERGDDGVRGDHATPPDDEVAPTRGADGLGPAEQPQPSLPSTDPEPIANGEEEEETPLGEAIAPTPDPIAVVHVDDRGGRSGRGGRRTGRSGHSQPSTTGPPDPTPPPPSVEESTAAGTPATGLGFLTLATTPWTEVSENGRVLGTTPLIRVELPAGQHRLRLVNREQGIDEPYRVTIRPGETLSRRIGLR
ncbi:MAG: protein kinase [Sandaracinaceae bacterium]